LSAELGEADGHRDSARRSRPILVWFISLGYGLIAVWSLLYTPLLLTGVIPVSEPYRSDLERLGMFQWVVSLGGALLMLAFCFALFRLRSSAVHWCEALLALSLTTTIYQFVRVGVPSGSLGHIALASTTFSVGLLVLIYLYSRRLRFRGSLA